MGLQILTLLRLCYTIISFNVFRETHCITLTLLPHNDNLENTEVTLRCSNDDNMLGIVRWVRKDLENKEQFGNMQIENNKCTASKYFTDNSYLYTYDCTNGKVFTLTIKAISREMNGDIWTCKTSSNSAVSHDVTIIVKVPVLTTRVNPDTSLITRSENSPLLLTCTTSECRPKPKFFWYKDNSVMTDGDETILSQSGEVDSSVTSIQTYTDSHNLKLTRDLNGWYLFCTAGNYNGRFVPSKKILLNLTYPPDRSPSIGSLQNNGEIVLLLGDVLQLVCSITGGNPVPILQWNQNNESPMYTNGNTVSKNISWQATGPDPSDLICRSLHPDRNDTVNVKINVLYPPGPPEIAIQTSTGAYVYVNKTLSVIERWPFTLRCFAKSNPPVSLYKWNNMLANNNSTFYSASPDRSIRSVSCDVSNVMRISDSRFVTGNNITYLDVNVLYPPTMNIVSDATIIEGDNLDNLCNFTDGNPSVTKITWSWQGRTWNVNPLQPYTVSRNQTGSYRCTVQNLMVSSDATQVVGNASGELNISVQYKAAVLRFAINETNDKVNITVNEYDAVNLTCEIEGLPLPTGQLLHQSLFNQNVEELPRYLTFQTSTNIRLQSIFQAQCMDNGIRICSGTNTFYNGFQSTSSKNLSLFVMCMPRKSPYIDFPDEVKSPTLAEVTLSFTALAYPVPPKSGYIWIRNVKNSNTWENISASGTNTNINTSELQSNLTIKNVSQFDYGLYMLFIDNGIGSFNYTFNLIPGDTVIPNDGTSAASSNASVVAAGAAVGGVAFLVAVIIFVVFYKKRLQNKKQEVSRQFIDLNISNDGYKELNHDDQQSDVSHKKSDVLPGRQSKNMDVHGLQELDDFDENVTTDFAVYGNAYEMIKRIERVDLDELFPYLTDKTAEFFGADYAKLPQGLTKPYEFSQKPENIALNRYHGIYPYDHSRVKIPSIPEYFTNACYIDGYKKKKAYIASLGPLSRTSNRFVMFWQMVWSEKSDVIVMLTKLTEPSGVKCEQYWPKDGTSVVYGEVTVTSTGEEVYSDFVMRTFSVLKGGQKRKFTHFHFMAWPDKSIPDDVTCLLEFRRKVKATHTSGPMIVHCSAGIGRTGTLIAIDILIEEGQKKGSVNVLECVKTMREQRTNMVQTVDQYYYIFKTLVNALVFDNDAIPAEKIHKYVESSKNNRFSDMFQKFNLSVESDNTKESDSRKANKVLIEKNRVGSDIPGDAHRVRLVLNKGLQTSDYINAVYLNSYKVADHFIVAQTPLLNGIEDFLCLIYQEKCCCVVSMDGEQARQDVGSYLPPDNSNFTLGNFSVHCSRLDTKDNYIVRKLKIEITGQLKGAEKVIYHFQFLGWLDGNKVPNDPLQFVEFTKDVERFADQFGAEESHVLVHCLNAFERGCLFCAVVALIEKIKHEKEVCIPNTLRQIRTRRKLAIPTLEQFKFCYQAADAYVTMEKAGTSNAENSYMNVTMA